MKAYYKKNMHIYVSDKCATAKYGLGLVCYKRKRLGNTDIEHGIILLLSIVMIHEAMCNYGICKYYVSLWLYVISYYICYWH